MDACVERSGGYLLQHGFRNHMGKRLLETFFIYVVHGGSFHALVLRCKGFQQLLCHIQRVAANGGRGQQHIIIAAHTLEHFH